MSMPEPEPEPAATDGPTPPPGSKGCWVFGGLFLSMAAGAAATLAAGAVFGAPIPVMAALFLGTPALYLVALTVLGLRRMGRDPSQPNASPEDAASRLARPVAGVGAVILGGVILAPFLNAPWWVPPILVLVPVAAVSFLARPFLKDLPARLKRALPSPERAARPRPPSARAVYLIGPTDPAAFPAVPGDPSGPGTRLARRLPGSGPGAGCVFSGLLAVTLLWNGFVSLVVWEAVRSVMNGKPEWFLIVFLIPFALVGLVLLAALAVTAVVWLVSVLVGTVAVEVDDHPFVPGGRYQGFVLQAGLYRLTKVGVELTCEEAATYQAGSSESTDKKVVSRQPAELPEPLPAAPVEFVVTVPADAMHSFAAAKNRITWTVTVSGRVLGRLPYQRSFQAVVRPGEADVT
jgi:hypothetical protein